MKYSKADLTDLPGSIGISHIGVSDLTGAGQIMCDAASFLKGHDMSRVRDVIAEKGGDVCTIEPEKTVLDAAAMMNECRIGALIVMKDEKVVGIFTERDVMNRVVAQRKDPAATSIRDVMTEKVAICEMDTSLESCRAVMTQRKIRHLPVVEKGLLKGMISGGDILARKVKDHEETIKYLHEYMHGPGED